MLVLVLVVLVDVHKGNRWLWVDVYRYIPFSFTRLRQKLGTTTCPLLDPGELCRAGDGDDGGPDGQDEEDGEEVGEADRG